MPASLNTRRQKAIWDGYAEIAEILDRSIALYPRRPAVAIAGRTWSYQELGKLVETAAFRIKQSIPKPGSRVAIVGGNHISYIAAYWSAQRLNCPTVEIDRNESLKTVIGHLASVRAQFVVTDRDDLKLAVQGKIPVEMFDQFPSESETSDEAGGMTEVCNTESIFRDSSEEASIIYTSGTTASAKGVVLSQGNFCFITQAFVDYLDLTEEDRCALVLPLCHIYGKSVLLSAFAAGAAVIALDGISSPQFFLARLSEEKCTVFSAVPYHLHMLAKSGGLSKYDLSSLRVITSSANRLSPSVIDNLSEALAGIRLFSMYGLTEAPRACFVPPELLHLKKGSCGRPLPGVEIRIIAEDGSSAPAGAEGEVQLRGPNIMKGYWRDDDLTKATIVDGWLKTGDIGHLDEDKFLYIDGRKKDIIKCAGERINPQEIEEVLMEHPGVGEAAVVGEQDSLMGETIHAYLTLRDLSLKTSDLRDHCCARLSHNKVPYQYTIVDRFPRTGTGKIQKNILAKGWPSSIWQQENFFKE